MPNLRCERLGPFDTDELREELTNLEFEYMMDLAPSKPPSVVRLCECKDEDYEGYHVRVFVGDYEYLTSRRATRWRREEDARGDDVRDVRRAGPRGHRRASTTRSWRCRASRRTTSTTSRSARSAPDAFFKEKEERKKLDEEAATKKAAEQAAAAKPWTETAEEDRDVGVLFPGQGTQKVGMARALIEASRCRGSSTSRRRSSATTSSTSARRGRRRSSTRRCTRSRRSSCARSRRWRRRRPTRPTCSRR